MPILLSIHSAGLLKIISGQVVEQIAIEQRQSIIIFSIIDKFYNATGNAAVINYNISGRDIYLRKNSVD